MHKRIMAASSAALITCVLVCAVLFGTYLGANGAGSAFSQSKTVSKLGAHLSRPAVSADSSAAQGEGEASASLRGMWITYFEIAGMFDSENGFKSEFDAALDKCLDYGINAVFVHTRSHLDAYYPSELFPWSKYVSGIKGTQGKAPDFDPLEYMITAAHERSIEFHAWVNPYRVAHDSTDISLLADSNPAKKWLTDKDTSNDTWVREANGGLYLNPAVPEVQALVVSGVREITDKYNVDGVHFDDYFYPTTLDSFDEKEYAHYRASVWGTPLSIGDWRRANVNGLIERVWATVKGSAPDCDFGISPMASISNNYSTVYADIAAWLDGNFVDYVMPQLYFGFEYPKKASTFTALLEEWDTLFEGRQQALYVGLAAYKIGSTDEANAEWSQHDDMLSRQITRLNSDKLCDGYVFYSLTTFFADSERHKTERLNVKNKLNER